jgi:hypothetical protein
MTLTMSTRGYIANASRESGATDPSVAVPHPSRRRPLSCR